jgi:hypothetical protein
MMPSSGFAKFIREVTHDTVTDRERSRRARRETGVTATSSRAVPERRRRGRRQATAADHRDRSAA